MRGVLTRDACKLRKPFRANILEPDEADPCDGLPLVKLRSKRRRQLSLHHIGINSKVDENAPANRPVNVWNFHVIRVQLTDLALSPAARSKSLALTCPIAKARGAEAPRYDADRVGSYVELDGADFRGNSSGCSIDRTDKSMSRCCQYRWSSVGHSTLEMLFTDACSNHGKSLNATNSSLPASSSQKPCGEMFVTSTREVAAPRCSDFIASPIEDSSGVY